MLFTSYLSNLLFTIKQAIHCMYQPAVFFIVLRYLHGSTENKFSRFISWLSIIGIMIGVMALVMVCSIMNGFERELQKNTLEMIPQVLISTKSGSINPKKFPESKIKIEGITRILPLTTADVVLQSAQNIAVGVMLGIDPDKKDPLAPYLVKVQQTDLISGAYNVILGAQLARNLAIERGDCIRVIVPSVMLFTPIGRLPMQRLFNVIGIFYTNNEIDSYQMLVNIKDASRIMCYTEDNITGWRLWLKEPLKVDKLKKQLLSERITWKDWRDRKGELFQAVRMEKNIMGLLSMLIVVVASFNIIASIGLKIVEKKGEIAILQTQGLMPCQIMVVFVLQGVYTGVIGSLFGAVLGILLSNKFAKLMPIIISSFSAIGELPVEINVLQVISIVLITIFISLLSTLYPSWCASTVHPAETLRYE